MENLFLASPFLLHGFPPIIFPQEKCYSILSVYSTLTDNQSVYIWVSVSMVRDRSNCKGGEFIKLWMGWGEVKMQHKNDLIFLNSG